LGKTPSFRDENVSIRTIEVICTGDELLLGDTLNTNLAWLGQEVATWGIRISRESCLPDDWEALVEALRTALDRADVTVVIGGLGPTRDDLTRPVAAEVLGCTLEPSPDVASAIRTFLAGRRLAVSETAIAIQSEVLVGADILPNRNGTAPGFWCACGERVLVLLPGPPSEFQTMVLEQLKPRILPRLEPQVLRAEIQVSGIPESRVAEIVEDRDLAGCSVGYCARPERITVRLETTPARAEALADLAGRVRAALAPYALPEGAPTLAAAVGRLLGERQFTVATAESCTGGGVAAALTDVPGCSAYFMGSVVTYANAWKRDVLGVPEETLERHGAVSEETVHAMLAGLLARYGVDCGIAVSGIAGPDGGTPEKPVGLVVIGTAVGVERVVRPFQFRGDRAEVRRRATNAALNQLRMQLIGGALDLSSTIHR
jgi:nicotinamide-nucleotide amidase